MASYHKHGSIATEEGSTETRTGKNSGEDLMKSQKGHVMLSYNSESQAQVLRIKEELEKFGYKTWMDVDKMHGDLNERTAEGVEGAAVVVIFMTQKYEKSRNCKKELNYAEHKGRKIVPVKLDPKYEPSGALGLIVAGKLYTTFSDESQFKSNFAALKKEIDATPDRDLLHSTDEDSYSFNEGDTVAINVDWDELQRLQVGHSGINEAMEEYVGRIGIVTSVKPTGDISVQIASIIFNYNPCCLCKVESFAAEDKVRVRSNEKVIIKMQEGRGGWNDDMSDSVGKVGDVLSVDDNGNVRVSVDGRRWTFSPAALEKLPSSTVGSLQDRDLLHSTDEDSDSFNEGDTVAINVDWDELQRLQVGHSGINEAMEEYVGRIGIVTSVKPTGDISVQTVSKIFNYNPCCLCKVESFSAEDKVRVRSNKKVMIKMQGGRGGWNDAMSGSLGKVGDVLSVDDNGNVRVSVNGHLWTFSPAALKKMPSSTVGSLQDRDLLHSTDEDSYSFNEGDTVAINVDWDELQRLQVGHSGTNKAMEESVGRIGTVMSVKPTGDIAVKIASKFFIYNPCCLCKVESFSAEDKVRVRSNKKVMIKMQEGRCGWNDAMSGSLGKVGDVLSGDDNGNFNVNVNGHLWTFSPAALKKMPSSTVGSLQDRDLLHSTDEDSYSFNEGDTVAINVDWDELQRLQVGHSGTNKAMEESVGRIGIVTSVKPTGDIAVKIASKFFIYNPCCLCKVESFSAEDKVRVRSNEKVIIKMQEGRGGWNDDMSDSVGKVGDVLSVDDNGNVRVSVDGRRWTFSPAALEKLPSSTVGSLQDRDLLHSTDEDSYSFNEGDTVAINVDWDELQRLQVGHSGINEAMEEYVGRIGIVTSVKPTGDVSVESFSAEDKVRVRSNKKVIIKMQEGRGGWNDAMSDSLGKVGDVLSVDDNGNVRVSVNGHLWTFSPAALKKVPSSTVGSLQG
eukprot:gene14660-16186_t